MLLGCYLRQGKLDMSLYRFMQTFYALVSDAFKNVCKAFVGSLLVWFFIDGLYHYFLHMKVMRKNPKTFQAAVQSTTAEQICKRDFN